MTVAQKSEKAKILNQFPKAGFTGALVLATGLALLPGCKNAEQTPSIVPRSSYLQETPPKSKTFASQHVSVSSNPVLVKEIKAEAKPLCPIFGGDRHIIGEIIYGLYITNDDFDRFPVGFPKGETNINADYIPELKNLSSILKENPCIRKVEIQNHTQCYMDDISQGRAENIKKWLITDGIEGNRLIASGYGCNVPPFEQFRFLRSRSNIPGFVYQSLQFRTHIKILEIDM